MMGWRSKAGPVFYATVGFPRTVVEAQCSCTVIGDQPGHLFRCDYIYLTGAGLEIFEVKVGQKTQAISRGTPVSYFSERLAHFELLDFLAAAKRVALDVPLMKYPEVDELVVRLDKFYDAQIDLRSRGRRFTLDTAEIGNVMRIELYNPTDHDIVFEGCFEGLGAE